MSAFLSAAEIYVSLGWRVLPIHSAYASGCSCRAGAACRSVGKHPRTAHGAHDATLVVSRIASWAESFADTNIGIATGRASDLLVVDVDPRNGGRATLVKLERELGRLPPTPEAVTGGSGSHLFFRAPSMHTVRGTLGDGIDIKFEGGYVVAAPSRHASGAEYAWADGRSPSELKPVRLPAPWIDRLAPSAPPPAHTPAAAYLGRATGAASDVERRARSYARHLPPAVAGQQGHRAAFLAAAKIAVGFGLDGETAFRILWDEWNPRCLPRWSESDLRRKVKQALVSSRFAPGFVVGGPRGTR